jgi:cytochrome c peroxidase
MKTAESGFALLLAAIVTTTAACGGGSGSGGPAPAPDTDPPEVQVGERLFLEGRFAQFYFANSGGDINSTLTSGDPVMNTTQTTGDPLPGPFCGESMNCRACHLVDELQNYPQGGVRTYGDFARHSPIPGRDDGILITPRNSPPLVDATLERDIPVLFHFDGEFPSIEDLVAGTMTGRNFGWLSTEGETALGHIAAVIRNDNGNNALAKSFGGGGVPYATLFLGTDPAIPAHLRLPEQYRIDVATASDSQVLQAVAAVVGAYVDSLRFSMDDDGRFNGSPYDLFLKKNGLPCAPDPGESNSDYSRRLLGLINQLSDPVFVTLSDGKFKFHPGVPFQFGAAELQGLKVFFTPAAAEGQHHSGNCVACHVAPAFTDFGLHNTGASQVEYDGIFGDGAFAAISVPDLATRNANFDAYLPPSPSHPDATSRFRTPASLSLPGYTDLGAWNVVGNPDLPDPQDNLSAVLCGQFNLTGPDCKAAALLPLSIAYFKTPTVRDLGQSNPYLHTGAMDTIEDVVNFYVRVAGLAHDGQLRNASKELSKMFIDASDVAPLTAFLNALNEDYN